MADNSPRQQLEQMPKPPVAQVVTSVAAQANAVLVAGVGLLVLAGAFYGISRLALDAEPWVIAACVSSALAPTPLLIGAIMWLWVYVQGGKRKQLAAGRYYVHWQYDAARWEKHCAQGKKTHRKALIILAGCFACFSLLFAMMVHFDNDQLFFGTLWSHYGLCLTVGLAAGGVIGMFCQYLANITDSLKRRYTAQSLIGPDGVYITGQFWPMDTFGHKFLSARLGGPPDHIEFTFNVKTNHGWNETKVHLPIPPAERATAEALVNLLVDRRSA